MDFTTKVESLNLQENFESDSVEGLLLQQKFLVGKQFDDGSFSWVFECSNVQDRTQKLVVKISAQLRMLDREAKCLRYLQN